MKKFKKSKKAKSEKDDISSLYYWGSKNILIASSWDKKVRLYDDSTSDLEGTKRYSMKKHEESVNFIDFKESEKFCASCSDDGLVIIFNYGSNKMEGTLKPDPASFPGVSLSSFVAEVKICKFLNPHDCLVSADLDGYLHFWGVTPSPRKNELLCSVRDENTSEVGTKVHFPIRAMDFDYKNKVLFTGDEMGFMLKWDLSLLLHKLDECAKKEKKVSVLKTDILLDDPSTLAYG